MIITVLFWNNTQPLKEITEETLVKISYDESLAGGIVVMIC